MLTTFLSPRVIAISIARLYLVAIGQWEPDESWSYDPLLAVENAEIAATIIALSVPALKPLLGSWAHVFSATFKSSGTGVEANSGQQHHGVEAEHGPGETEKEQVAEASSSGSDASMLLQR